MNTRVVFTANKKLKTAAQKKARAEGVTLSAVLKQATEAYVNNTLSLDIVGRDIAHARTTKSISAKKARQMLDI